MSDAADVDDADAPSRGYRRAGGSGPQSAIEHTQPEVAAEMIDRAAITQRVAELARDLDMPKKTAQALMKRLETRFYPVRAQAKRLRTGEMVDIIDEKIELVLGHIDEISVGSADLKSLAIALGILVEKRQLLKGEPTQILSMRERDALNKLLPDLLKEAARRGQQLEAVPMENGTYAVASLTPVPVEKHPNMGGFRDEAERKAGKL